MLNAADDPGGCGSFDKAGVGRWDFRHAYAGGEWAGSAAGAGTLCGVEERRCVSGQAGWHCGEGAAFADDVEVGSGVREGSMAAMLPF